MDPIYMEKLPIDALPREMDDYLEYFDALCLSHNFKEDSISTHFITSIGRKACSLLKNHAFHDKPILLLFKK